MNRQGFPCHCARALSAQQMAALFLARVALDAAREQFDRLAQCTDEPIPGIVDAADYVEAAARSLCPEFSDTLKGQGGDA